MDKRMFIPGATLLASGLVLFISLLISDNPIIGLPNFWGYYFFDVFVLVIAFGILGLIFVCIGADRASQNSPLKTKNLSLGLSFAVIGLLSFYAIERVVGSNTPYLGWTIYLPIILFGAGCLLIYFSNPNNAKPADSNPPIVLI